jgi:UPF0755 protein
MKSKKLLIILGVLLVIIISIITFFALSLKPVSKTSSEVTFIVKSGDNKFTIVDNLKKAGLIKNKIAALAYIFVMPNKNLQAGSYNMDRSDSAINIINKIADGKIIEVVPTIRVTFVEGKTFKDYAKLISTNFDISYDDIIKKGADKEFLKELINTYWFLDESILNKEIYYPLEGYLAPDTYEFYETTTIEGIFKKLLDNTDKRLTSIKDKIESSKYSVHEILTIASIAETEAVSDSDRKMVSQVVYKRLDLGMALGMDVTTYYGVGKDMKDGLTANDLAAKNAYNTRNNDFKGLPASSICNPSLSSIKAAVEPSDTDYVYFVANMDTGEIFFFNTYEEFMQKKVGLN